MGQFDNGSDRQFNSSSSSITKFSNPINFTTAGNSSDSGNQAEMSSLGHMLYDNATWMLNITNNSLPQNDSYLNNKLPDTPVEDIIKNRVLQIAFSILYVLIFVLGVVGNVLVCYVVFRNKAMQTVTNYFITNLALSDILMCILAVPFTPLYTFLERWVFGVPLCHLVPYAQGCSIYISTLTLTAVAIDRFFVIVYPFQPRMKLSVCISIIVSIWVFALLVTLPYGLYVKTLTSPEDNNTQMYCEENWPSEYIRRVFSISTTLLQFALPFLIIMFCYVSVSIKLNDRAKLKPGSKTSKREEADRDRKKRTNRMLIAMVAVFGISWLPINLINMINDFSSKENAEWRFTTLVFFISHAIAMSSTCYNPFLYAWLNENFRKEFKQLLPCFFRDRPGHPGKTSRYRPSSKSSIHPNKQDKNNNNNRENDDEDTRHQQHSLLNTGSKNGHKQQMTTNLMSSERSGEKINLSISHTNNPPEQNRARDVNMDYVNVSKPGGAPISEQISSCCTSSSSPSTTTTTSSGNRTMVVQFSPQKTSPAGDDVGLPTAPFTSGILETHFEELQLQPVDRPSTTTRPLLDILTDVRNGQIV